MRLFRNSIAREREYSSRAYQIAAAIQAVSLALAGKNSAIELPTGTGKTLIACLASVFWKALHSKGRVVLVVPSRTLVGQHFEVARWIASEIVVDRLRDEQSGDPGSIRATLLRADLLVTTPGLLAGALERGLVDQEYVKSIELVIADEFDTFVVTEEAERETVSRFADSWERLKSQLSNRTRYLVKSATLSLGDRTDAQPTRSHLGRKAQLIHKAIAPSRIEIPERQYARVIPYQSIVEVGCSDARIADLLTGVSTSKGMAHAFLDKIAGPTDYDTVERLAPSICEGAVGRQRALKLTHRASPSVVSPEIRQQYCKIAALKMMPQHIVEDLTLNLDVKVQGCQIKTSNNELRFLEKAIVLDDHRPDSRFEFQAGAKVGSLVQLLNNQRKKKLRGVVFCRTIRLLNAFKLLLDSPNLSLHELTGEMADSMRTSAIKKFRDSESGVLLMTRTTGGRGLDLPFADYGVFYSPKSSAVQMWQEISRIRSTVSNIKSTFVLCYDNTFESSTLMSTISEMAAQGLRVAFARGKKSSCAGKALAV